MRARLRLSLSLFTIVLLGGVAACAESVAGPAAALRNAEIVGRWLSQPHELSPESWHVSSLAFTIDGRFTHENRSYGLYEGQPREALSAVTRTEGKYRIAGNRLVFEPQRLVWWDRFEGADAPVHQREPYPWGPLFENARFTVEQDRFTMHFTVAPADAVMQVVAEYTRER